MIIEFYLDCYLHHSLGSYRLPIERVKSCLPFIDVVENYHLFGDVFEHDVDSRAIADQGVAYQSVGDLDLDDNMINSVF